MRRKIAFILNTLDEHFPNPLPPLNHIDSYTLLISVLLSAQCTDKRVNIVTKELFLKASSPKEMIQLTTCEIEEFIRTCGLYKTKARAIFNLSHLLIDNFNGKVPSTLKELETLPGVGHKTASVVLTQSFNIPAFPVDTHIHRLGKRWGLTNGKDVIQTEKDLKILFKKKDWGKIHLQIIYYARAYCRAKKHIPEECLICSFCNSTKVFK